MELLSIKSDIAFKFTLTDILSIVTLEMAKLREKPIKEMREAILSREHYRRKMATMLEDVLAEGERRGRAEGREETLRFMIKMDIDRDKIVAMIMEQYGFNRDVAVNYYEKVVNNLGKFN